MRISLAARPVRSPHERSYLTDQLYGEHGGIGNPLGKLHLTSLTARYPRLPPLEMIAIVRTASTRLGGNPDLTGSSYVNRQ